MTHPSPSPRAAAPASPHSAPTPAQARKALLPDPAWHWTTRKAQVFLGGLARTGCVAEAARGVGMARQSAYRLRARLGEDSDFASRWDAALAKGRAARQRRRPAAAKATVLAPESDIFGIGK